jgi:hypothetical protein
MFLHSVFQLLIPANLVPNSPILIIVMMETMRSPETSVLTRGTRRQIQESNILHSHRSENLKSYTAIIFLSTTDRYSVFREVRISNLQIGIYFHEIISHSIITTSYPLPQLTGTVFSLRYELQILLIGVLHEIISLSITAGSTAVEVKPLAKSGCNWGLIVTWPVNQ